MSLRFAFRYFRLLVPACKNRYVCFHMAQTRAVRAGCISPGRNVVNLRQTEAIWIVFQPQKQFEGNSYRPS